MRKGLRYRGAGRLAATVPFVILAVMTLYPLLFTIATSGRSDADFIANPIGIPSSWTFDRFVAVIEQLDMVRMVTNSFIVVPSGLVLYVLVASMAAFALSILRFKGQAVWFFLLVTTMVFPQMVVSLQLFLILARVGLINSFVGLVTAWVAYLAPFATYLLTSYFKSIPGSLIESARMDGASHFYVLTRVVLPVATPMLSIVALVGFLAMWNELPFSVLILQRPQMRTLVLGVALLQGEYGLSTPETATTAVVAGTVPLVAFLLFQRRITGGALAGAIKG